ncbi:MAG: Ig-like domain-containing protein [Gemmataceae bacterium]|nr:Ig-like domain-containing protein [Gemmataceae bacterium]
MKLVGSVVNGTGASVNTAGRGGGQPGGDGWFLLGQNTATPFAGTVTGATLSLFAGPRNINPFILGTPATPRIAGGVGDAKAYGVLEGPTPSAPAFAEVAANAPLSAGAALLLLDVGPAGFADDYAGFDMLLYIPLHGTSVLGPRMGVNGAAPQRLPSPPGPDGLPAPGQPTLDVLESPQVYATLVPEGATDFRASLLQGGQTVIVSADRLAFGVPLYITANRPPVAADLTVVVPDNTAVPVSLPGSDPDGDPLTYTIVAGPASGVLSGTAPDLTYTSGADFRGQDEFDYHVTDSDGRRSATYKVTFVRTLAPALRDVTSSRTSILEGSAVRVAGVLTDPGEQDTLVVDVDWGDGTPAQSYPLAAGTTEFKFEHAYPDDNPSGTPIDFASIRVQIRDTEGRVSDTVTLPALLVSNAPPRLIDVSLTPVLAEGEVATLSGKIADPGQDPFTLTVHWGDGIDRTYCYPAGTTSFLEFHLYPDNPADLPVAHYGVNLSLRDDDNGHDHFATGTHVVQGQAISPPLAAHASAALRR